VYHEMFDMGSRLKDLQPLRDGDVVIDGGTNVGLFSLSVLQDESVQVACGWDCAWMVCIPCGVTWVHSGDLGPPLALLAVRGRPPVGCALPQGKKLTIHGFEPIKPTWEAAVRNLQGHSNVTVHNVVGACVRENCGHHPCRSASAGRCKRPLIPPLCPTTLTPWQGLGKKNHKDEFFWSPRSTIGAASTSSPDGGAIMGFVGAAGCVDSPPPPPPTQHTHVA
jgi:hypothetical protein